MDIHGTLIVSHYAPEWIWHTNRQRLDTHKRFLELSRAEKAPLPHPPKGELVCHSAHFVFSIAACTLPVGMWQSLIPWLKPPKTGSSGKHTHLISSQCLCLFVSTNIARTHLHWAVDLVLPCIKGSGRRQDASLLSCAFKMQSVIQLNRYKSSSSSLMHKLDSATKPIIWASVPTIAPC